jgi:hypothetical protein
VELKAKSVAGPDVLDDGIGADLPFVDEKMKVRRGADVFQG